MEILGIGNRKLQRLRLVFGILMLLMLCPLSIAVTIIYHNFHLDRFASQLDAISIPPETELISISQGRVSLPTGNNCQMYAEALFATQLDNTEIQTFYKGNSNRDFYLPNLLNIHYLGGNTYTFTSAEKAMSMIKHEDTLDSNGMNRFTLSIATPIFPSGMDFRCW